MAADAAAKNAACHPDVGWYGHHLPCSAHSVKVGHQGAAALRVLHRGRVRGATREKQVLLCKFDGLSCALSWLTQVGAGYEEPAAKKARKDVGDKATRMRHTHTHRHRETRDNHDPNFMRHAKLAGIQFFFECCSQQFPNPAGCLILRTAPANPPAKPRQHPTGGTQDSGYPTGQETGWWQEQDPVGRQDRAGQYRRTGQRDRTFRPAQAVQLAGGQGALSWHNDNPHAHLAGFVAAARPGGLFTSKVESKVNPDVGHVCKLCGMPDARQKMCLCTTAPERN